MATVTRRQVLTWPPSGAGLSKLGYSAGSDACDRSSGLGQLTQARAGPAVLLGGVFVGAVAGVGSYKPGLADRVPRRNELECFDYRVVGSALGSVMVRPPADIHRRCRAPV
jgi:hypothetical protein